MNRYYIQEMFEPTLLYGLSLAVLGVAASYYYGHFSVLYDALVIVGAVLAQMSVNVISDYFDYASGLDRELSKSKSGQLSGGSSLIASGKIKPLPTLMMGMATLSLAAVIGVYILITRVDVLPIMAIAALSILLYSKYIKKVPYLSEVVCSLNYVLISFGCFVVVASASSVSYGLLFSFVPAGIMLGGNALFVNSVPDRKIDQKYGSRHSAVMLKTNKNIGLYYLATQSIAFVILAIGIAARLLPVLATVCFVTLPTTYYVFGGLYRGDSRRYGKYLSMHTMSSFVIAIILALSYLLII